MDSHGVNTAPTSKRLHALGKARPALLPTVREPAPPFDRLAVRHKFTSREGASCSKRYSNSRSRSCSWSPLRSRWGPCVGRSPRARWHLRSARVALLLAGAALLLGYGSSLNATPVPFGRIVGLYIATLFVVWEIITYLVFHTLPGPPVCLGGALVIAGGLIITFWRSTS